MPERRYEIDWLRMFAVLLLIYFHTAVIFVHGTTYHIENRQKSVGLDIFTLFVDQWYMPLFFFIAGAATSFALRFRSGFQYVRERVKRLFIPLVFGTLVIIPPQIYYERLSEKVTYSSYIRFYPHFFQGIYPKGNFTWNQLWFIAYLFVFSLACLPLFLWLRGTVGKRFFLHPLFCLRVSAVFRSPVRAESGQAPEDEPLAGRCLYDHRCGLALHRDPAGT